MINTARAARLVLPQRIGTMSTLSPTISHGILNLPGADAASKATAERLLKLDHESHHCFFHPAGLHNHLSHYILAVYDLGAPASMIQAIYDSEARSQRPIDLKENGVTPEGVPAPGDIKEHNWTTWLGDAKAYSAYVTFFSTQIAKLGVSKTLEDYIFSPAANDDSYMLLRLVGGAMHPFIQVGYGLEFDSEIQVAAGIAQAAVHDARTEVFIPLEDFDETTPSIGGTPAVDRGRQPSAGPSFLSILRQIYDSPELTPVLPYDANALLSKRRKDFVAGGTRLMALKRLVAQFDPGNTHAALEARVEELVLVSTLLVFGTGKPDRKPRLDFFLMHLLTSSLFVPSFFKYIPSVENKRALLRTYVQPWGVLLMTRGRPRIDPALLMSYDAYPLPPDAPKPHPSATGDAVRADFNPWNLIIADAIHAPDSHTIKSLRTLLYGATRYGTVPKGGFIGSLGADGSETHAGMKDVDGTIFVRAAGVLMDTLGWVTHGQVPGGWDRSALGWDDAWKAQE